MKMIRWLDGAAIALSILVVAGLGFALRPQHTPTRTTDPASAQVDRPAPPALNAPSALFVTDSYAAGIGLAETYYGCRAAVRMGWLCDLSAEPGTGYVSGGSANRFPLGEDEGLSTAFIERLPKLRRTTHPDIVVFDGGRNDNFVPKDAEFEAMSATLTQARRIWPAAKIVFIRPRLLSSPADDLGFDDDFIAGLQAQPDTDIVVVDPIGRFADTDTSGMLANNGSTPNQRGELALSGALFDSLSDSGLAATT
jgi:hypothetical protein